MFEVILRNDRTELVDADAYQQEGPMTTFFAHADGRQVIDCWSARIASVRTADILVVRRTPDVRNPDPVSLDQGSSRTRVPCSNTSGRSGTTTVPGPRTPWSAASTPSQ